MSDKYDFTCDPGGEDSQAISSTTEGMPVYHDATIMGDSDLSNFIHFNDGGRVYEIRLVNSPGHYDYVLQVDAKGPKGAGSGSGHLAFTDESGDIYKLGIYSSTRSVHTVRYNSEKPNIVKIRWYN